MLDIIADTVLDTLKTSPYLFLIYLFLEYIQNRLKGFSFNFEKFGKFAPILGAVAGVVPQCGFSSAASALYVKKTIKAGTLVAVFLATSDEAIPVMVARSVGFSSIGVIILIKFVAAIIFGYLLNLTLFKNEQLASEEAEVIEYNSCELHKHHETKSQYIKNALYHTVKISSIILITMIIINLIIFLLGEKNVSSVLLTGSVFQPFITAFIGLVPGCSISVLLTELFVSGQVSLGSSVAGLCTGAGFGYIILIKNAPFKQAAFILLLTYVIGVFVGVFVNLIGLLII